ncbi:MAG: oligosaccharide flippase family protein [Oscillospiraceae bacterium]|jgi:O-antigen/teichoic acid export membrane protein|nr:oligosaccharide flippase family protein [Oscillospiraceae bacterium]
MAKHEVRNGAMLSYVLIALNAILGLVVAPYMLRTIGESEYGVYKSIGALTASVAVLELGLGGTMQRYIAKFNALKETKRAENFSAMGLIQAGILCFVMLCVCAGLFFTLDGAYGGTFSAAEMHRAKQIFLVQMFYVSFHIFENFLFGVISGHNRFVFSNSVKIIALLLKTILYFVLLPLISNALVIVGIALGLELLTITVEFLFLRFGIGQRIRLHKWEGALFRESFMYTLLLFVQSLVIQFNGNIDGIVIGAMIGTSAVTLYSFAITIFNMYEQCAMAVSNVVLPTVTNQIHGGATAKDMENTVVKFGRAQWIFLGAALFGIVSCGREFFILWLGKEYLNCWYLSMILIIPVTFPLVINVCLAMLKAKNLLLFRTISMIYAVVLNILLTVAGTWLTGEYWMAAIGTAASTIIGSCISMNIYYHKKLGLPVTRIYLRIAKRITLCLLLASLPCIALNFVIYGSWFSFVLKVAVFLLVYALGLLTYGLSPAERESLPFLKRGKKA